MENTKEYKFWGFLNEASKESMMRLVLLLLTLSVVATMIVMACNKSLTQNILIGLSILEATAITGKVYQKQKENKL